MLSGSLYHLAVHTNGTPCGYPVRPDAVENFTGHYLDLGEKTDHNKWEADLKRWALAFSEDPDDVRIYDQPSYEQQWAEEKRRSGAIHQALREIEPWWEALWD